MKASVRIRSLGGKRQEPVTPYECKGCKCLSCGFEGECWCPTKEKGVEIPPVGCDNYQKEVKQ